MTIGGNEEDKEEPRGFSGLSSLVSEVETILASSVQQKTEDKASPNTSSSRTDVAMNTQTNQPRSPETRKKSSEPTGGSVGLWIFVILFFGFLVFIISDENSTPPSQAPRQPVSSQSPAPTQAANPSRTQAPSQSQEAQVVSRPQEVKPPAGGNDTLSMPQLRYCLAEDIRLEGSRSAINNYNNSDVDRFNVMVSDYNRRCGSFRYRPGTLESARRDIEPHRTRLYAEGRERFTNTQPTSAQPRTDGDNVQLISPTEQPVVSSGPSGDATVRAIQRKLNELGYNSGVVDGLMGRKTRSAIMEFQRDRGIPVDGLATDSLLRHLENTPSIELRGSVPAPLSPPTTSRNPSGIPNNARLNAFGNGWQCNPGYYRTGNECRAVQIPQNAKLNYLGNGWDCNRGYFRQGTECRAVQVPRNASLNYLGNGWDCNRGYFRQGTECRLVQIPQNASLNYLGNGWDCNRGYFRQGNECRVVQIPRNASLNYLGNGWDCNRGYFRQGNECREVQVPANARLNYLGNGWDCNPGFRRVGTLCQLR